MNKLAWNRIIDFLLWIAICLMLATGFILRYRLPPGSRGGGGLSIWDWSRHDWGDLHTWLAYTVCGLVVLHLLLHWRWLWYTAWPRLKWPVLAGLLAGLLLVAGVWLLPIERGDSDVHGGGSAGRGQGDGGGYRGGRGGP
ncbi:MAG TPA: DUF4405 domain-containing protein [Kiritimatiellia bacterium]|nr:DUF4405 domain-containing protein [Kiritimatiellia bacterium]